MHDRVHAGRLRLGAFGNAALLRACTRVGHKTPRIDGRECVKTHNPGQWEPLCRKKPRSKRPGLLDGPTARTHNRRSVAFYGPPGCSGSLVRVAVPACLGSTSGPNPPPRMGSYSPSTSTSSMLKLRGLPASSWLASSVTSPFSALVMVTGTGRLPMKMYSFWPTLALSIMAGLGSP